MNLKNISLSYVFYSILFSWLPLLASPIPSGAGLSIIEPCMITVPGNYRLSQDINGTVSIAASNVFFDMNNRTISGSIESENQGSITITNGTVRNGPDAAVLINGGENITFRNVGISDSCTGMSVLTTSCLRLEQVTFSRNTEMALVANDINNSFIIDSTFNYNTSPCVVEINDSNDVELVDVSLNNNSSASSLDVLRVNRCTNCRFRRKKINNNFANGPILRGKYLQFSRNIFIEGSEYNSNAAPSGAVYGLKNENSFFTTIVNSQSLNNEGMLEAIGFSTDSSEDTIVDTTMGGCNISTTSCSFGFEFTNNQRTLIVNSVANQNNGSTTGKGMDFRNEFSPLLLRLSTNGNVGTTSEGVGIDMVATVSGTVRDIFALNNVGITLGDCFGLRVRNFDSAALTTVMFSNQAQGQAANNFVVSPGQKLLTCFDVNNGTFDTVNPNFFDNVSVE